MKKTMALGEKDFDKIVFLEQLPGVEHSLQCCQRELDKLKEFQGVDVPSGEQISATATECVAQIASQVDELLRKRLCIFEAVQQMENQNEKLVLELRYFSRMSWREVAPKLYVSLRQARRIHDKALEHLKLPENAITLG